jgi:anti-anti-sigma factor
VASDVFLIEGNDPPVVCLVGECDIALRDKFLEVLAGVAARRVILDMERVTYMDSTILGVIAAQTKRKTVALRNPPQPVKRAFQITGLDGLVETDFGRTPRG